MAASLLVHATLLAWMGLAAPSLQPRPDATSTEPAMVVHLEREPLPDRERAAAAPSRAVVGAARASAPAPAAFAPSILHRPVAPGPTEPAALASPAPVQPPSPAPANAPAARGARDAARTGAGPSRDGMAAMRGFGRATVGCEAANLVHLTPGERDLCNQRFGAEGRKAPNFSGIAPEKRVAYEAAAERSRKCHFYDTPVPMAPSRDRNERIETQFDPRTPESQHKASTAVLPEDSLAHRLDCWP